jgi:hypothetical protein
METFVDPVGGFRMARTRSGCWTCRLRTKKKCDEGKPTCRRCKELRIPCFGYGARPTEAQLGDDRRARIAKVGAVVAEGTFRVWRPQKPSAPKNAEPPALDLAALDRVNAVFPNFLHPHLLSNYTKRVFWLDSRFYQCPTTDQRSNAWLTGWLARNQTTHLAAALMGLTWTSIESDLTQLIDIKFTRSLSALHGVVIASLGSDISRSRSAMTASEVLSNGAVLVHTAELLLIFEVWRTLEGDWIAHMRGIGDVLRWIQNGAPEGYVAAGDLWGSHQSEEANGQAVVPNRAAASVSDLLALRWAIQSFMWNDLTAAVWVGPYYGSRRYDDLYIDFIGRGSLQMDKFMGCEDAVLAAIGRISFLETRKQDLTPDTLGLEILQTEETLNACLHDLLERRKDLANGTEKDANLVTEMWTHAALVYLHTFLRDTAQVVDCQAFLTRGYEAYLELPRRLDLHIALPFGILASTTTSPSQAHDFIRIAKTSRALGEINPGQRKALPIVQECARLREVGKKGVTWRDGARSLGLVLLPV